MQNPAEYLTEVNDAHSDPRVAVETGNPDRPWVLSHDPEQWACCPACAGEGFTFEPGSPADRSVGWLGEEPSAEECTNCDHGWVRVEVAA